jgi:DNA-binding LytR/AlgR family response regulator
MKITILDLKPGEEEEIIVRCAKIDSETMKLLNAFKGNRNKMLHLFLKGSIHLMDPKEIYYFESVDDKVFAYGEKAVYETKKKLYELEEELPSFFIRTSKSSILNLRMISSLSPMLGGRFEAKLKNGENVVISRQYVSVMKERLGV